MSSLDSFITPYYRRHNQRRQEHLATIGLPIPGKSVLEVGAGIGDHTSFFLDRGCSVTSTDGRGELLEMLRKNYPQVQTLLWDVEMPPPKGLSKSQIVYAYGILYHTKDPELVLKNLSSLCDEMLLLETCVSFGEQELINLTHETDDPTQALGGIGCRPTRKWIFNTLKKFFPYVYLTKKQPWHEEFPIDWSESAGKNWNGLSRSVFVGSRVPFNNENLSTELLSSQER